MRILSVLFFLHFTIITHAQDFPDYRSKRDNFIKIQEKDIRYDLASFTIAGIDESTGKLPLRSIPSTNAESKLMKFEGGNIQVIIKAGLFDASKHKIGYYDEKKYVVKIDNKGFFGNYGEMPQTTIEEVTLIVDKDTIRVPPAAIVDLYNPSFSYREGGTVKTQNRVYLSNDNKKIYVYMLNKEPKSSYEVTWVIQDKKYLRRVVDFGLLK